VSRRRDYDGRLAVDMSPLRSQGLQPPSYRDLKGKPASTIRLAGDTSRDPWAPLLAGHTDWVGGGAGPRPPEVGAVPD
jgi:hypothetical protein